jgi:hypothetical protein
MTAINVAIQDHVDRLGGEVEDLEELVDQILTLLADLVPGASEPARPNWIDSLGCSASRSSAEIVERSGPKRSRCQRPASTAPRRSSLSARPERTAARL